MPPYRSSLATIGTSALILGPLTWVLYYAVFNPTVVQSILDYVRK